MKTVGLATSLLLLLVLAQLSGCAGSSSGSVHTSVHYGAYYDPYPYWGRGRDTTVIINPPGDDGPERPAKPPVSKPPSGGIGRPKAPGRRR